MPLATKNAGQRRFAAPGVEPLVRRDHHIKSDSPALSDARATMRPAAAVEAHRQRECDPQHRSRRPIQSQGNRFERQPPAPPQTYDANFVREGGAPVAFAMSDEPERKPERKGRQIDAFREELKTR